MKNILKIKISYLALFLLIFTSCNVDDDPAIVVNETIPVQVSFQDDMVILPSGATTVEVPVTISQVFNQLAQISYRINGNEFSETFNTGTATVNIPVDFTGLQVATLEITDFKMLYSDSEGYDTSVSENNTTTLIAGALFDSSALTILLDWEDPVSNDLDLWGIIGMGTSGFVVDNSQSVTRYELIQFPNSGADGAHEVYVRDWASAIDPIPFVLYAFHPDETMETFESTIPNAAGQFNLALSIDKAGSSYTITQVNPTTPL